MSSTPTEYICIECEGIITEIRMILKCPHCLSLLKWNGNGYSAVQSLGDRVPIYLPAERPSSRVDIDGSIMYIGKCEKVAGRNPPRPPVPTSLVEDKFYTTQKEPLPKRQGQLTVAEKVEQRLLICSETALELSLELHIPLPLIQDALQTLVKLDRIRSLHWSKGSGKVYEALGGKHETTLAIDVDTGLPIHSRDSEFDD